jgi:hypothetical protein
MDWEGCGTNLPLHILKYNSRFRLEGLRKSTKVPSRDSWPRGRDFKHGHPEFEAGLLTATVCEDEICYRAHGGNEKCIHKFD